MAGGLIPEALAAHLREVAFPGGREACVEPDSGRLRVGVEVEALALDLERHGAADLVSTDGRGTLDAVRALADKRRWQDTSSESIPGFRTESGDRIAFEPGGQVEWVSSPSAGVWELLERAHRDLTELDREAQERGIRLIYRGMDPLTRKEEASLQVHGERYLRMDRHLSRIGPWGRRMMRQTAAVHVNLDWVDPWPTQWALANALAPITTAVFANSRMHEGTETGHRNYRAHQWRHLDPGRTGIWWAREGDPVARYLEAALDAPAFLLSESSPPPSFREVVEEGRADLDDWRAHLTTLFPEVRPRGYLELRSVDALPPELLAAPLVFLVGVLYHPEARARAQDLLPAPSDDLMARAGRAGMEDPELAALAEEVWGLALEGAADLPDVVDGASLEVAREFAARYTARGRDGWDATSDQRGGGTTESSDSAVVDGGQGLDPGSTVQG